MHTRRDGTSAYRISQVQSGAIGQGPRGEAARSPAALSRRQSTTPSGSLFLRFELLDERSELTSICEPHPTGALRMPENILILANWKLAATVGDTMPQRAPNDDDDAER